MFHTLDGSHISCGESSIVLQQSIFDSAIHTEAGSISFRYRQRSSRHSVGIRLVGSLTFRLISPTTIEILGVTAGVIGFSSNQGTLLIRREPDITDPTPHFELNLCVVDLLSFHYFFHLSAATSGSAKPPLLCNLLYACMCRPCRSAQVLRQASSHALLQRGRGQTG